jgi:hypothetical protein
LDNLTLSATLFKDLSSGGLVQHDPAPCARFNGSDASYRTPWPAPYITDMFESEFPAHTAAIKRKIASIECDDALILPHRANPAGSDFRERQVATYLKVAWQQIVRAFVTTPIDFGCSCVDPVHG